MSYSSRSYSGKKFYNKTSTNHVMTWWNPTLVEDWRGGILVVLRIIEVKFWYVRESKLLFQFIIVVFFSFPPVLLIKWAKKWKKVHAKKRQFERMNEFHGFFSIISWNFFKFSDSLCRHGKTYIPNQSTLVDIHI